MLRYQSITFMGELYADIGDKSAEELRWDQQESSDGKLIESSEEIRWDFSDKEPPWQSTIDKDSGAILQAVVDQNRCRR